MLCNTRELGIELLTIPTPLRITQLLESYRSVKHYKHHFMLSKYLIEVLVVQDQNTVLALYTGKSNHK